MNTRELTVKYARDLPEPFTYHDVVEAIRTDYPDLEPSRKVCEFLRRMARNGQVKIVTEGSGFSENGAIPSEYSRTKKFPSPEDMAKAAQKKPTPEPLDIGEPTPQDLAWRKFKADYEQEKREKENA